MNGRRIIGVGAIVVALLVPAAASGEVLYDQTDNAVTPTGDDEGLNFSPSNYFGADNFDNTADDFEVPAGQTWTIDAVDVAGGYSESPADPEVNVILYADDGGKPGTEIFRQDDIAAAGGPNYSTPITGAPSLTAGIYWLSVQHIVGDVGYWSWGTRSVQSGSPAQWSAPGEESPCEPSTWRPRTSCWPSQAPDQTFKLSGTRILPDSAITLAKPKLNKKRGTAKIPVTVPGAGELTLAGKNLFPQNAVAASLGTVNLKVQPKGKLKKKLKRRGKAKAGVAITFTPTGGEPNTLAKTIRLKRRIR